MSKPENPPAFPLHPGIDPDWGSKSGGMTLRDYFAGQALVGSIMDHASWGISHAETAQTFAATAYAIADAMLAHRQQERPE